MTAAVRFRRPGSAGWEPWPEDSQPGPPSERDAPFEKCHYRERGLVEHQRGCAQWRGVHFVAIRFGDREWRGGLWYDEAEKAN